MAGSENILSSGMNTGIKAGSSGSGIGGGMVASGVMSGLTEIATTYINAQRAKNTYKFNAAMSQLQGRLVRLSADKQIKDIRAKAASIYSSQRAGYAKAGVQMTGSVLEVMLESAKNAELDEIFVGINADLGISSYDTQAGLYKLAGKSAMMDANTSALKSILNMGIKTYQRA